ncbi:hypothetical protein Vadar_002676 [Vaccinium darrowii]|uniref:Uncharacterized protein n=1 Tax=Vaccinium darrowii TaxID=229202 RepID=A0ACB7Y4X9_9ERIC|nr:hypothetical protein Vadar_002676 [Vaccinium darrowii]
MLKAQQHMNAEDALNVIRSRDDNLDYQFYQTGSKVIMTNARGIMQDRVKIPRPDDLIRKLPQGEEDPRRSINNIHRSSLRRSRSWEISIMIPTSNGQGSYKLIQTRDQGTSDRGWLKRFVKGQKQPRKEERPKNDQNKGQARNAPIGEIVVIHGGPGIGGESNNSRKADVRRLRLEEPMEVNTIEGPTEVVKSEKKLITFSQEDEVEVIYPHDDPLVITMVVANYRIKRILVDTGSSADVMYFEVGKT